MHSVSIWAKTKGLPEGITYFCSVSRQLLMFNVYHDSIRHNVGCIHEYNCLNCLYNVLK